MMAWFVSCLAKAHADFDRSFTDILVAPGLPHTFHTFRRPRRPWQRLPSMTATSLSRGRTKDLKSRFLLENVDTVLLEGHMFNKNCSVRGTSNCPLIFNMQSMLDMPWYAIVDHVLADSLPCLTNPGSHFWCFPLTFRNIFFRFLVRTFHSPKKWEIFHFLPGDSGESGSDPTESLAEVSPCCLTKFLPSSHAWWRWPW